MAECETSFPGALTTRRSIRHYKKRPVPEDMFSALFELCRYAPTSRNVKSVYYLVIQDHDILSYLSTRREDHSAPIGKAPAAVAVCVDPSKTIRIHEDGHIAAYHLLLSAWHLGLGTCWIAAMDREDVKEVLGVPLDHYIATITPIGFPARVPAMPHRRRADELFLFVRKPQQQ